MLCEQLPELEVVKAFNCPENFISEFRDHEFDFCILDIGLPEINGLMIAELLKEKPVIFITAHKEYAVEAFEIDAIDYLLKPIKIDRLALAVNKVKRRAGIIIEDKRYIQLNTSNGKALLFFNQLGFLETSGIDSRDKIAHLKDGSTILLKNITFEKLEELLPSKHFCRINKKIIIAMDIVRVFTCDQITTTFRDNKDMVPYVFNLNESYRERFIQKIKL